MDPGNLAAVVISTPGAFDPETGDLQYARHLTGWQEPGLLPRLRQQVGGRLEVENDVNLIALAEQRDGAAVGFADFCLLWHDDDGFGAAVVIDGRLHRGATGGAGEVGYLPVPGAPVVRHVIRANSGGFVKLAGLPAIMELGEEFGVPGRSAATVVRRAAGSAAEGAGELLDELAERYALGLAAVVAVLDPQAVVLSGSVLQAGGEPLRSRVERQLGELAMTVPAVRLGDLRSPILAGALHAALDTARDAAFAAAR
jgi:predicted NBD/HSP70 family sugar kinase